MKIALFTNFLNHHQLPFALAMNQIPDVEYIFVETGEMGAHRVAMGWGSNENYDFVLKACSSKEKQKQAEQLSRDADIVLIGHAPINYLNIRMRTGKMAFRPIERFFKKGTSFRYFPANIARLIKHQLFFFQNSPLYFLCMSGYLAYDLNLYTNYRNKCFKWAYFTENKDLSYEQLEENRRSHRRPVILWAGRYLDWKHPEAVIQLAKDLKDKSYDFEIKMIGGGPLNDTLKQQISADHMEDAIQLIEFMKPSEVRKYMEDADIFLFTSDFNEGWGAVLNESMSSGCAVVTSHACGSSPFLVNDGVNGFIYESGNSGDLFHKVKLLLEDEELRYRISRNAFHDMRNIWSPGVAAERLLELSNAIEAGNAMSLFKIGPGSPAPILNPRWYQAEKQN